MLLSERLLFLPKELMLLHRSLIWGFVAKISFDLSKTITILVHGLHSSRVFPGGNERRSTHPGSNPPAISSVPLSSPEAFTIGFPAHFLCHHHSPAQGLYIKLYFFFVKVSETLTQNKARTSLWQSELIQGLWDEWRAGHEVSGAKLQAGLVSGRGAMNMEEDHSGGPQDCNQSPTDSVPISNPKPSGPELLSPELQSHSHKWPPWFKVNNLKVGDVLKLRSHPEPTACTMRCVWS